MAMAETYHSAGRTDNPKEGDANPIGSRGEAQGAPRSGVERCSHRLDVLVGDLDALGEEEPRLSSIAAQNVPEVGRRHIAEASITIRDGLVEDLRGPGPINRLDARARPAEGRLLRSSPAASPHNDPALREAERLAERVPFDIGRLKSFPQMAIWLVIDAELDGLARFQRAPEKTNELHFEGAAPCLAALLESGAVMRGRLLRRRVVGIYHRLTPRNHIGQSSSGPRLRPCPPSRRPSISRPGRLDCNVLEVSRSGYYAG